MKILISLLALISFSSLALADLKPIAVLGFTGRTALVAVPDQYTPTKRWPMIIVLHGYGSNARQQAAYLGLASRVSRDGYILLAPEGTKDSTGKQFWNAWSSCCNRDGVDVDDVGFIDATLKSVSLQYTVDPSRIYVMGHSNGAFAAYRFACERPGQVAAVFALAGTMGPEACRNPAATHIIHIHGNADETILYEGGSVVPNAPRYAGALETAETWAGINGCSGGAVEGEGLDLLTGQQFEGAETSVLQWTGCKAKVEVWTMNLAPHVPNILVPERPFTKIVLEKMLSLKSPL